jgi:hypothetical protein
MGFATRKTIVGGEIKHLRELAENPQQLLYNVWRRRMGHPSPPRRHAGKNTPERKTETSNRGNMRLVSWNVA